MDPCRTSRASPGIDVLSTNLVTVSENRFYTVHTPGAQVAKIVHQAVYPCVLPHENISIT